jgi:hypothetical protein
VLSGLIGAPHSLFALIANASIIYLLLKAEFKNNLNTIKFSFPKKTQNSVKNIIQSNPSMERKETFSIKSETPAPNCGESFNRKEAELESVVVCNKDTHIEARVEEKEEEATAGDDVFQSKETTSSEIRLIIREFPEDDKEFNGIKNVKTQVIVRRTNNGIPVVIVETRVKKQDKKQI